MLKFEKQKAEIRRTTQAGAGKPFRPFCNASRLFFSRSFFHSRIFVHPIFYRGVAIGAGQLGNVLSSAALVYEFLLILG
jgi:hypothetical protein